MSALEEITGEHYEISIDLDEGAEREKPKEEAPSKFNNKDIEEFEKGNPKKAIWHGKPTKAFLEWLEKKDKK